MSVADETLLLFLVSLSESHILRTIRHRSGILLPANISNSICGCGSESDGLICHLNTFKHMAFTKYYHGTD